MSRELSRKPKPSVPTRLLAFADGQALAREDTLVAEEPLELGIVSDQGAASLGLVMRTPGQDLELVLGFLFSEGIIRSFADVASIDFKQAEATLPASRALIRLEAGVAFDAEAAQRVFPVSAACGACGKSALQALNVRRENPLPMESPMVPASLLLELPDALRKRQELFSSTGGLHASGRFDCRGQLLGLAEDVGRHNAMDKLIGAALREESMAWGEDILLLSGRVGYDLIQKAIMAGCPLVASVGAPSSLAVELATLYRITLVGFLRDTTFNVYSAPERIS